MPELAHTSVRRGGQAVTVVLADDESMFRASLRHLLTVPPSVIKEVYGVDVGPGFDVIGEAGSGEDTIATVRRANPELLLLDLSMPRLSGLDALRELHASGHAPPTVVLSGAVKRHLLAAAQLGVHGLVLKDSATELLFEAIMTVLSGEYWLGKTLVAELMALVSATTSEPAGLAVAQPFPLTPRERQVLAHVVAGEGNKEIARQCAVSEETIKHHLTRIFEKVGASNRVELAMVATQRGLIHDVARDA